MAESASGLCPVAGRAGRRVPSITVRGLVRNPATSDGAEVGWFYCDLADCDVVYFEPGGRVIRKEELTVRVGAKEKEPPRTLCYCFGHTVEEIREEIERTGRCTVAASIRGRIRAGECRCELVNPSGSCCLGEVERVVRETTLSALAGSAGHPRKDSR